MLFRSILNQAMQDPGNDKHRRSKIRARKATSGWGLMTRWKRRRGPMTHWPERFEGRRPRPTFLSPWICTTRAAPLTPPAAATCRLWLLFHCQRSLSISSPELASWRDSSRMWKKAGVLGWIGYNVICTWYQEEWWKRVVLKLCWLEWGIMRDKLIWLNWSASWIKSINWTRLMDLCKIFHFSTSIRSLVADYQGVVGGGGVQSDVHARMMIMMNLVINSASKEI